MKVSLVSNDINLQKKLDETGFFEEVKIIVGGLNDVEDTDILLVSDKTVNFNEFTYWVDKNNKKIKSIYYMLSNIYEGEIEMIYSVLKAKNVSTIAPKMTVNQIAEKLIQTFVPGFNKQKNIITFFGADSKVGTTMTALGVAETIAKNTELKVCLLVLSGSPGMEYIKVKETTGLDHIKVKLFNSILTASELKDSCIPRNNLYILPGNQNIMDTRHYTPEHIEYLIQLASQEFSIVIIDAGCYWDMYGMTVGALNATNFKFLVTTQQKTPKDKFFRTSDQVLKLLKIERKDFMLIANKYISTNTLLTANHLADLYNMYLAGFLPYLEVMGIQAEEEERHLLSFNDKEYKQGMTGLCKLICSKLDIQFGNKAEEKKGIFGLFGGRKNV